MSLLGSTVPTMVSVVRDKIKCMLVNLSQLPVLNCFTVLQVPKERVKFRRKDLVRFKRTWCSLP